MSERQLPLVAGEVADTDAWVEIVPGGVPCVWSADDGRSWHRGRVEIEGSVLRVWDATGARVPEPTLGRELRVRPGR